MIVADRIDYITRLMLFGVLLMSLSKVIPFLPSIPDAVYYGGFVGLAFWSMLHGSISVAYAYLPFIIVMFISLWVNEIPAFFRVWFRLIAFLAFVFCSRSPAGKSADGGRQAFAFHLSVDSYPSDRFRFFFRMAGRFSFCIWI